MLTCEAKLSLVVVAVEDYCAITSWYTGQMCSSLKARADGLLVIPPTTRRDHGAAANARGQPCARRGI